MEQINVLNAILNAINDSEQKLRAATDGHNRLHALGESLEKYVRDIFAGTLGLSEEERMLKQAECFSYGGGKNNPPDAIIRNGDAIEIKKVETIGGVPLNSSYPKNSGRHHLLSTYYMKHALLGTSSVSV